MLERTRNESNARSARNGRIVAGFSLIELLVVIGVIGLLLALVLPALNSARSSAAAAACLSNTRQLTQAALNYAVDHHNVWVGWDSQIDRKQLLYPYIGRGRSNEDVDEDQVWHCPDNQRPQEEAGYGFNTNLNWKRVPQVAQPASTVGIVDAGINDDGDPVLATHAFPPSVTSFPVIGRPNPRHGSEDQRTVSVAFVDGSGKHMAMEPPFYPGPVGQWTGNGVSDFRDDDYVDEMWDLR